MTRSIARWTTALAAAALIGLPAAGWAQTSPSSQTPQTQTPQTSSATTPSAGQSAANAPADHVRQAKQALDSIPRTSIPAADRAKFAQLRTHLNNLGKAVAGGPGATAATSGSARATRGARSAAKSTTPGNWGAEIAAVDKILTDLIGPEGKPSTPDTSAAGATGTSGRTTKPAHALDDAVKDQLRDVRRHVTELAAAMSGTASSAPSSPATNPETTTAGQTTTPPAQPSAQAGATTPATAPKGQVDQTAAKQHLGAARDALSQVTQMPEAARLQGDARTQVAQLISNFNELITTQTDWHPAYAKVDANLTALLGPQGTESATPSTAAQPATPGAVGTTGSNPTAQVDPAIKAKLMEVRRELRQFQQAAGGTAPDNTSGAMTSNTMNPPASTASTSTPAAGTYPSSSSSTAASNPASPTSANPPSTSSPTSTANPTAASSATGYPSSTATTGTTAPAPAQSATPRSSEADRHLDAIADIVNRALGTSRPPSTTAGTTGTTTGTTGGTTTATNTSTAATSATGEVKEVKIDRAQLEQIRMHIEQLRQLLKKSGADK